MKEIKVLNMVLPEIAALAELFYTLFVTCWCIPGKKCQKISCGEHQQMSQRDISRQIYSVGQATSRGGDVHGALPV